MKPGYLGVGGIALSDDVHFSWRRRGRLINQRSEYLRTIVLPQSFCSLQSTAVKEERGVVISFCLLLRVFQASDHNQVDVGEQGIAEMSIPNLGL